MSGKTNPKSTKNEMFKPKAPLTHRHCHGWRIGPLQASPLHPPGRKRPAVYGVMWGWIGEIKGLIWGEKLENFWNKKKPKSTLLADNTQGLKTTKQKPRTIASAAPHPITPAGVGGGVTLNYKTKKAPAERENPPWIVYPPPLPHVKLSTVLTASEAPYCLRRLEMVMVEPAAASNAEPKMWRSAWGGGGMKEIYETTKPKSTLLADNT